MIKSQISKSIFREYDIRGIVGKTLHENDSYIIGKGFCSFNKEKELKKIIVCRDGRLSSAKISNLLIKGIIESGIDVVDIGCGPTPMLYFASIFLSADAGIMVTGSHNPANHNGFKIVLKNKSFYGNDIQKLYKFILKNKFIKGKGSLSKKKIQSEYEDCLLQKSGPFPNLKVIWDCGNGATGEVISSLIKKLPGDHRVLFNEIDGNFPNHHPDPTDDINLKHLKEEMKILKADLGISFDGDGDRIGVLSKKGNIIPGDLLTAFLAGSILKKKKNQKIVLDIKSSQTAIKLIEDQGGLVEISQTGHSLIKTKLKKINAQLAGEMSGHIFFNDTWYGFDDAIYAALRCLQEIKLQSGGLNNFLSSIPKSFASPEIRIECSDSEKFKIVEKVKSFALNEYDHFKLSFIDGIRTTLENGWWLIRGSNTQAALIIRAEGNKEEDLDNHLAKMTEYLNQAGVCVNLKKYK